MGLKNVSVGPSTKCAFPKFELFVNRQEQDFATQSISAHFARRGYAVQLRQGDIQNDDIGTTAQSGRQSPPPIGSNGNDFIVARNQFGHVFHASRMILDDDHGWFHFGPISRNGGARGVITSPAKIQYHSNVDF